MRGMNGYPGHSRRVNRDNRAACGNNRLTTLRGILVPVDWDDEGNVTAVALSTRDEREYLIDKDAIGKGLQSHVREEVELSGILKDGPAGRTVTVKEFRLGTTPGS
jgi:hypothetical protein